MSMYLYSMYQCIFVHLCTYRCTDVCTYVCMHVERTVENCACECTYLVYESPNHTRLILYQDVSVCENPRGFLCQSSLAIVSNYQTMFKNMMNMPMPLRKKGQQLKLFISQPCLYLQILFFLSDCLHQNMMIGM